jgi:hypothetical protein
MEEPEQSLVDEHARKSNQAEPEGKFGLVDKGGFERHRSTPGFEDAVLALGLPAPPKGIGWSLFSSSSSFVHQAVHHLLPGLDSRPPSNQ